MRKFAALALVIFLVALFVRVYNLNLIPVFVDEAIYVRWAQVMRAEASLRFLPLSDGKQPLFMWAVIPALKLISDPLVAGRAVSVLTGMGTLAGVFALSYVLFQSRRAALLASLLWALSPFAVFFDRMALADSMLACFGVWALVFAILAAKNLRFDFSFLSGFALGGAMLTKSPSLFFGLLMPLTLMFVPFRNKKKRVRRVGVSVLLLASTYAIANAMYGVLRLGPEFHMISARNSDYIYPLSHVFSSPFSPLVGNLTRSFEWFFYMGPVSLIILSLFGAVVAFPRFRKEVVFLLAFFAIPLVVQAEFARVFTARYILFVLPPLVVLAGAALATRMAAHKKYAAYLLIALFLLQSFSYHLAFYVSPESAPWPEKEGYLANWTAGSGIREASEIIRKRAESSGTQIVVGTEGYFGTLPDGLQIYLERVPGVLVIGVGLGINKIPDELRAAKDAGNIVYLVANASRLNFTEDFSYNGLSVVAAFEKVPRTPGTHSYVQDGPVDTLYLLELVE